MAKSETLKEFPRQSAAFLKKLSRNNKREWFEKHRDEFERDLLQPAIDFVIETGEEIRKFLPDIVADPRTDKSIFRIYKDVRFSKNKKPFKTHQGILFWEGERKKLENSGFYFQIDPKEYMIGAGMYMFPPDILKKYREAAADEVTGKELLKIRKSLEKKGYTLGPKKYKRMPKGYDPDMPQAEMLLFGGLTSFYVSSNLQELYDSDVVKFVAKKFKEQLPLHKWLSEAIT